LKEVTGGVEGSTEVKPYREVGFATVNEREDVVKCGGKSSFSGIAFMVS